MKLSLTRNHNNNLKNFVAQEDMETYIPCAMKTLKGFKEKLPTKVCATCGKLFSWRKRWRNTWDRVVYCSERCRRQKR